MRSRRTHRRARTGRLLLLVIIGCGAFACETDRGALHANDGVSIAPRGPCVPGCAQFECGDDGCGGSCGACPESESCANGQCLASGCTPNCESRGCGPDGCGGTCGDCGAGQVCGISAQCRPAPPSCVPSCDDATCGPDGCGGSCGDCETDRVCTPDRRCRTIGGGCGPLSQNGACDDNTLIFCADGGINAVPCEDSACAFDPVAKWYACGPVPCTPTCPAAPNPGGADDGCGGVCPESLPCGTTTAAGECAGSTLAFCIDNRLQTVDCLALELGCAETEPGWFDCADVCVPSCDDLPFGAPDGCGGVCEDPACATAPRCVGFVLEECTDGVLTSTDCAELGLVCALDDGVPLCADPICTPNCDGVVPGADDGCGQGCPGEAGGPCGEIPPTGQCVGDVLQLCAGTVLVVDCQATQQVCDTDGEGAAECVACTPTCAGLECGDDGCGGSCGTCGANEVCNAGQCDALPCDGIPETGRCLGNTLQVCVGGQTVETDCLAQDQICIPNDTGAGCVDPPCVPDCAGKVCGGDGCGGSCGFCTEGTCVGTECVLEGCGPVTDEGQCVADILVTCQNETTLEVFDCPDFGLVCGIDPFGGQLDCVAADACVPDCEGKACGPDGCGGECGECTGAAVCQAGKCNVPCGEITSSGTCVGSILSVCNADSLEVVDCAISGLTCQTDPNTGQSACADSCIPLCLGAECGPDGCGGMCGTCGPDDLCQLGQCVPTSACGDTTEAGVCDGDVLSFCQEGVLYTLDCSDFGAGCESSPAGVADCSL